MDARLLNHYRPTNVGYYCERGRAIKDSVTVIQRSHTITELYILLMMMMKDELTLVWR